MCPSPKAYMNNHLAPRTSRGHLLQFSVQDPSENYISPEPNNRGSNLWRGREANWPITVSKWHKGSHFLHGYSSSRTIAKMASTPLNTSCFFQVVLTAPKDLCLAEYVPNQPYSSSSSFKFRDKCLATPSNPSIELAKSLSQIQEECIHNWRFKINVNKNIHNTNVNETKSCFVGFVSYK